jgi:hypothetical protein
MKTDTKAADPAHIEPGTETAETHSAGAGQAVTLYPGQSRCDLSEMAFEELDRMVQMGAMAFVEVGHALAEIKVRKLWKEAGYESWTAYAEARFGKSGSYADRQIRSAKIMSELVPIGTSVLPTCEAQIRPLTKLDDAEDRRQVWVELAKDAAHAPTGKEVEAAVNTRLGKALPEKEQAAAQTSGGDAADHDGSVDAGLDGQEATAHGDAAPTDVDDGEAQPDGEELEPIRLADGSEVPDEVWVDGMFDRKLMQTRVDELSEEGDPGSVPRQKLLVSVVSLINQFLDQHPENESFQDLKAVSSSINKVLLVGAKPGYYGDVV